VQFLKFPCSSFSNNFLGLVQLLHLVGLGPFVGEFRSVCWAISMDCRRYWASKCQGRQVLVVGFLLTAAGTFGGLPSASKQAPELVKLVPGGVSGVQFLAFVHFPRKRTLSGWALLFAMGKVTSDDFLYGRKHSRISKCRETRSKVRSKSGSKTGPGQHPKSKKHPYTGKSSCKWGQKRYSKTSPKTTPQMMGKSTVQNTSRAKGHEIAF
jgi:hypothetical protein